MWIPPQGIWIFKLPISPLLIIGYWICYIWSTISVLQNSPLYFLLIQNYNILFVGKPGAINLNDVLATHFHLFNIIMTESLILRLELFSSLYKMEVFWHFIMCRPLCVCEILFTLCNLSVRLCKFLKFFLLHNIDCM